AVVGDLDADGLSDIVFSPAESSGDAIWWQQRADGWRAHVLMSGLDRAHTLDVGDIDGDDDLDVLIGEMHTSDPPIRILVLENVDGDGSLWMSHSVEQGVGMHNGLLADLDHDGDADIVGANFMGNPPLNLWLNRRDPAGVPRWTHLTIGEDHERTFGLDCGDLNGDSWPDVLSGSYFYANPGPPLTGHWSRHDIPDGWHGILITDVDGDTSPALIAQRPGQLAWLEPGDWSVNEIGSFPPASHAEGSQGYAAAPILGAGNDVVIASGGGLYLFHRVDEMTVGEMRWRRILISPRPSDEGVGVADIDGDGALDLVASTGDAREVEWYENPKDSVGEPYRLWQRHAIGSFPEAVYPDRIVVGDLDGDRRPDVVVSEENGLPTGAQIFWWSNRPDGWRKRLLTTQASTNSMHSVDIDHDGDLDLVTAEHKGRLSLTLWRNNGRGGFRPLVVDRGHENHLGALPCDLDRDLDFDLVGIGWDKPQYLHVWRNDSQGGLENPNVHQQ
ncbi:MAG: VCBS repeat-containing protein, partial [Candidatus Tectomicrobia bacterium]|nr:VCBS repeat-containing protein [Candidatus Tectomicrobia bacterium]